MTEKSQTVNRRFVISVLTLDRVGIIQCISSSIADLGGDIDGMSQTVIHGYFTVILTASFPDSLTAAGIREEITRNCLPDEASVVVRPFEEASRPAAVSTNSDRYFITLTGKDRPGILKTVTTYLAENGVNIEDYYFTLKGDRVTHIGELAIPDRIDIKQMQGELQALVSSIDLVATLQHENLFRAANEIFAIRDLFKKEPCAK